MEKCHNLSNPKSEPPTPVEKDLRPISLTCILSKELETYPVSWLWEIVLPPIDPFQFGAMARVSTVHALVEICHYWFKGTDCSKDKNFVHTVLIDYSRAFDRIHPNILLNKLLQYDIPTFLVHWIADFLSDRTQRVKLGNILSTKLDIWGTVPQGTKMGVLLFLLMIDDLRTNVPTYKYVDDTTLFHISSNPEDTDLQKAVNAVVEWSKSNHMKLNTSKTKEMFISFSRPPPKVPKITVNGTPLERVDEVTLLGLKLSNDLTWHHHVEHITKKANRKLFCLNMLKRAKVEQKDMVKIYCSRVRPVIEYATPVWHPGLTQELTDSIEDIQRRACKILCPLLSYEDALSTMDLPTLKERRTDLCKAFFHKIQDPDDKSHKILPPEKDNVKNTRNAKKYPLPKTHTKRFRNSFLPYALYNLQ